MVLHVCTPCVFWGAGLVLTSGKGRHHLDSARLRAGCIAGSAPNRQPMRRERRLRGSAASGPQAEGSSWESRRRLRSSPQPANSRQSAGSSAASVSVGWRSTGRSDEHCV